MIFIFKKEDPLLVAERLGILMVAGNAKTETITVPAVMIEEGNESVLISRTGRSHDGLLVV